MAVVTLSVVARMPRSSRHPSRGQSQILWMIWKNIMAVLPRLSPSTVFEEFSISIDVRHCPGRLELPEDVRQSHHQELRGMVRSG